MKVFIILAGLLMLGACTGKPEGFVLKGELKGAPDDHWVFLTNTGQTHYYDSTRLKNGRFEFKGKVDGPELRCITYFKDPSQRIYGWDKIMEWLICETDLCKRKCAVLSCMSGICEYRIYAGRDLLLKCLRSCKKNFLPVYR